jgi:putative ABC transport system permease protein
MVLTRDENFKNSGYGTLMLKADNTKNVAAIAEEIKKHGYGVTTAQDMLDKIGQIFTMLGLLAGVIGGISLFVAAIGIINTMIMATYERTREIGVMRACGAKKSTIRRLFTFEAGLLGFWGGVIGLFFSFLLSIVGNIIADRIATSQNLPIKGIITFPLWLIIGVIAFTTIIGLLAGLYPANRAARLDPVEALRYE